MNNPLVAMCSGRLGNLHYGILLVAFWVCGQVVSFLMPNSLQAIEFLLSLIMLIIFLGIMARRLQDFDVSGKWALLSLLPFCLISLGFSGALANFIAGIASVVMVFVPGTGGPNQYGREANSSTKISSLLFGL